MPSWPPFAAQDFSAAESAPRQGAAAARNHRAPTPVELHLQPGNVILSNEGDVKLLDFGLARLLDLGYGNAASTTSAAAFAGITNSAPKPMAATVEFTGDNAKRLMSSPLAANLARSVAQLERNTESELPTAVDPIGNRLVDDDSISADGPTDQMQRDYETSELAVTVSPDLNQLYLAPTEAEKEAPSQLSEQRAALTSTMNGPVPSELQSPRSRRPAPAPSQLASQGSTTGGELLKSTGKFSDSPTGQIIAPERSSLDSAEFSALDWELPPTSEKSRIAGTPLYMAPEIWRGEPGTRRADIYSMGALLYELLHGVPPFADVQLATLAKVVNEQDAPPLLSVEPGVEPRMAAIVDRCLRRDPAQRFGSGDELREALEQIRFKDSGTAAPEGNPYRGLLAFEAEHRGLFFGRRSEIGSITERLRTEPLVLVAADSGVGKSSLCRAGVLPTVSEGALGKGRKWSTIAMVPGRAPLTALCSELSTHLGLGEADLTAQLTSDPAALARLLHRTLGDSRGLLLFIDQLEEMVTIADPTQSKIVGEALGHLCARIPAVRMLMTVRSDFLARVAAVGGLGDELVRALYILRPLTPDKIQEAIVGPAQIKGVSFESQELVDRLVESTAKTDGGLPLLQFALTELWEARKGDSITKAALDAIGGVGGALARHADQVMLAL
ncbi:MAG TPA: protein kinase, partial [Pseudomonadota bacterium]|nr:protein kinase [Pseudomonadota bacterium]